MQSIYYIQTLYIASFVGSVAFALSGFLVGTRKHLDVMGIFILAFLTANGGGVVRDLLVGRAPSMLISTEPFWLTAGVVCLATIFKLQRLAGLERRWIFVVCDGVGLVAFGVTGALIGLEEQVHFFGVLTLSLLTATGGGIIRDLLVNEVPEVLHGDFYGSIALLLGAALYVLNMFGWINPGSILSVFAGAFAMRIFAYKQKWRLPKIK